MTSHNNNNNNGGLRVRATEDIEPFLQLIRLVVECESQQQVDLITVHTKDSGFLALAIFIFILLCLVSPSTVCLQRASLMHVFCVFFFVFGECQAPPIGLEDELQRFRLFSVDSCGRTYS